MAWTDLPPAQGSSLQYYPRLIQIWDAIRERLAVGGGSTAWPPSNFTWKTGTITSVVDNGDGTVSIYDSTASADFSGAGWVDSLGNKRWTSCTQFDLNNNGSISASEGSSGGTAFFEPDGYAPPNYRIVLYPTDTPNASHLADPNLGFVYRIQDNGDTFVKITDDGRLTLNGGKKLSDYVGFKYQIIRYESAGTQRGVGFPQRYPPKPNDTEHDYGTITASTTTTITDASDDGWRTPKNFDGAFLKGKDILFLVGSKWHRGTIAAAVGNQIKFASAAGSPPLATAPTVGGGYWIVDHGAWWRPEFRLELEQIETYSGDVWVRSPGVAAGPGPWSDSGSNFRPWELLSTWYSGYTDATYVTHSPADDSLTAIDKFVDQVDVLLGESGPPASTPVTVFDVDAVTSPTDLYNPDCLFNPWLYWSLRGLDVGVDSAAFGAAVWIERKNYSGETAIPELTYATWQKAYVPANTRTTTITADTGAISSITMPTATPQAGAYSSLDCDYTVLDDDGSVKSTGTGTVTATALTPDGASFDASDVDKTVVIGFGRTRKYERRVRRLYPRSYFLPDENFDGTDLVAPPTEQFPGSYDTLDRSGTYAEYSELGALNDVGPAFVTDEAYRYTGDDYFHPFPGGIAEGEINEFLDAGYQGRPAPQTVSNFPRWDKQGTVSAGGSFWIEDAGTCWWTDSTPMVTHTGTGTAGSTSSILKDSALYKLWPTEIDNPGAPPPTIIDMQLRLSRFWSSGDRFIKMILEVAVSGAGTAADPYVWERRPIVSMDVSTPSNPSLTVSPAFSSTTLNRPYQIREPGLANNRVILNTWRGRQLKVRRAETGEEKTVEVLYSDDTRAYFADGTLGFTPAKGDTYTFIQWDPGAVVHYKPSSPDAFNGWVLPEHATQDTRGANWLLTEVAGIPGERRNSPTIVTGYGWFRRGDTPLKHYWDERVAALNALVWTKGTVSWSNVDGNGVTHDNYQTVGIIADAPSDTCAQLRTKAETAWASATPSADNSPPTGETVINFSADGLHAAGITRRYSYALATSPTDQLAKKVEIYVSAIIEIGDPDNPDLFVDNTGSGVYIRREFFSDDGAGFRSFGIAGTFGPTTQTEHRVLVGSDSHAVPTWPPCPATWADPSSPPSSYLTSRSKRAYTVDDELSVMKWNVSGGLTYVDTQD